VGMRRTRNRADLGEHYVNSLFYDDSGVTCRLHQCNPSATSSDSSPRFAV
jgi:hypothetical protein